MSGHDQEIMLGTGRLLGLFFGLVIVCALFFSMGFLLGRRTVPEAAAATKPPSLVSTAQSKPSPTHAESKPDCATPAACADAAKEDLTFYKAVEQNAPKARLEPASPPDPAKPEHPSRAAASGYMVQVAAVSKQEDAEALVHALRRKSYRVLAASAAGDKLYHVQVGPFGDLKDAEATRTKLISDGYNPILKK
jgi:DedD protein